MTTSALHIENLYKTYRGKNGVKDALKGISLDVPQGAFFGLLGPNGAGKSTLINILAGLVIKTSGRAEVMGFDIEKQMLSARMNLGIVPQELVLDTFFTVRQALDMHAGYYGVPKAKRRTDEIIAAMGLTDKADSHSRQLSGGMRRRLLIAKALVHSPRVLILDEPTAGVDVELRDQLWAYVRQLNKQGTTVLLTTHYLEEAEELCDRVAIINHGEVIANERTSDLLEDFDSKECVLTLNEPLTHIPQQLAHLNPSLNDAGDVVIRYQPSKANIGDILSAVCDAGLQIRDITTEQASLEDIFRRMTRAA